MFVTLGERWQGFGPAELTLKVGDIIPGSPISLEEMSPTDGLLADIVCLSPTLVDPLKDSIVSHVVGNMEDEGLKGIGYYTVFPFPGPAIFWLSLQKIVEATMWAQAGLRKRA